MSMARMISSRSSGDFDHLALARQVRTRISVDEQGAHAHRAGHPQLMLARRRHPHPTPGRHHPAALLGSDRDHAADGVDQLRAVVAMRSDVLAVAVVLGEREDDRAGHGVFRCRGMSIGEFHWLA
jgi:hypothetical protein